VIDTIYVEKEIEEHPRTRSILTRFKGRREILVERYGEVFNKRSQNFRLQKRNPSLIIAKKHTGHILSTPQGFGIGGAKNFYFSHMINCVYDCRYCFLQGMYASANYVLFINYEDFISEINNLIFKHPEDKLTFFSGYDCDSLALEPITGFASFIVPSFKEYSSAEIEFRTKSTQIEFLLSIEPVSNCIIAYSLMPEIESRALDHKTPSIEKRINAIKRLAAHGWKIGLRFDPLIYGQDWEKRYQELFDTLFSSIPRGSIHSISYGSLRFPKEMFKAVHKLYPEEKLLSTIFPGDMDTVGYKTEIEDQMTRFCKNAFSRIFSEDIVFKCTTEATAP